MKRPKFKLGLYLMFVYLAVGCFFVAGYVTIDLFETGSITEIMAIGCFLLAGCASMRWAFQCKDMEFPKKSTNPIKT